MPDTVWTTYVDLLNRATAATKATDEARARAAAESGESLALRLRELDELEVRLNTTRAALVRVESAGSTLARAVGLEPGSVIATRDPPHSSDDVGEVTQRCEEELHRLDQLLRATRDAVRAAELERECAQAAARRRLAESRRRGDRHVLAIVGGALASLWIVAGIARLVSQELLVGCMLCLGGLGFAWLVIRRSAVRSLLVWKEWPSAYDPAELDRDIPPEAAWVAALRLAQYAIGLSLVGVLFGQLWFVLMIALLLILIFVARRSIAGSHASRLARSTGRQENKEKRNE
jgi:hypothetical protein